MIEAIISRAFRKLTSNSAVLSATTSNMGTSGMIG